MGSEGRGERGKSCPSWDVCMHFEYFVPVIICCRLPSGILQFITHLTTTIHTHTHENILTHSDTDTHTLECIYYTCFTLYTHKFVAALAAVGQQANALLTIMGHVLMCQQQESNNSNTQQRQPATITFRI